MVKKITILALEPFLSKPLEKMHLAHISRAINEPHPTVRQWLNQFEKEGIIRKEHKGKLTLHYLNLESPLALDYIVTAEKLNTIKKCEKFPVLAEIVSFMQQNLTENSKALIFGSAALSFASANDIDVLIIGKDRADKIKSYIQRLGKDPHIVNVKSLSKVSKTLKIEIIKKHLLVKGSEDFVRWMLWQQ